ncbi:MULTISPECIES: hypothetical protein [unclassified Providencia]|uniref:hypothetical protein n=1 Tax=unclassified Providencia TaxID=2633465 RepID=UPI0012B674F2|nr:MULTISPECIES: hypothetical protein [unclassified Providencia]MTC21840.1 hypothetical protein [Providencia sp. wls1938]
MTEDKYYDYLVIGGEHDGQVFNAPHVRELKVPCEKQPLPKFCSRDSKAETLTLKTVTYKVIEHITGNDLRYFIASNDDLDGKEIDITRRINESEPRVSPIN